MKETISRQDLKAKIDSGEKLTLIEALPAQYYEQGHLPGAINIPHDDIASRAAALLPDRDAEIVVYCASTDCRNSTIAVDALRSRGYAKVSEYVEGKQDWVAAGLPLESSRSRAAG